ncbi:hypothetical protein [Parasitella parasitica]|uniref:Signal recognition particle subunit SRP14 n=1 Tax=Parasitella parasitica TaxID=35722 RepID=A0A0B7NI57_9FUNG|nr:hypothetical protein [Parasitella parasitica]
MKKKCRLTYKRIIPRYYGKNTDETVSKRRDAVAYWLALTGVCIAHMDGLRLEHLAKLMFKRKGANVSIFGAICKSGSHYSEKKLYLPLGVENELQLVRNLRPPRGRVLPAFFDNASIHKAAALIEDWVGQRGYKLLFLPPYFPFLNRIKEFWSKLKTVFTVELGQFYEKSKTAGTVSVTMKRMTATRLVKASKVKKEMPKGGGTVVASTENDSVEYPCLIRAVYRKNKISTIIAPDDFDKFQNAYSTIIRAYMDSLKKKDRSKKVKKVTK